MMNSRMMKRPILATIIALGLASPLSAGTVEGLSAFARNDFAGAFRELLPEAKGGDAEAQIMLAILYAEGKGVRRDAAEAVVWLKQAAKVQPDADYVLGDIYSQDPQLRDDAEAARAYRRAADQGFAPAFSKIGMIYLSGTGVAIDPVEAVVWLSLAAERGAPEVAAALQKARAGLSPEEQRKAQDLFTQRNRR